MTMDIIISIAFLFLLGLTILQGSHKKAGIGETPLMYRSIFVQFILNISILVFFALSIYIIFFYSWKLFLALLIIGFVTETLIIVPLIEKMLYFLFKFLMAKVKNGE